MSVIGNVTEPDGQAVALGIFPVGVPLPLIEGRTAVRKSLPVVIGQHRAAPVAWSRSARPAGSAPWRKSPRHGTFGRWLPISAWPSAIGPIVDGNVHLWDQRDNPVFWLSDRTLLRDMLGDYDSLPERHTLSDYRRQTAGYDVRGVIWSDAGAADAVAAADWVSQLDGTPSVRRLRRHLFWFLR